jgi:peroxiredoxin
MKRLIDHLPSMSPSSWLTAGVAITVVLAMALGIAIRVSGGSTAAAERLVGKPAPAFALPLESRGKVLPQTVSLGEQRGHMVLLLFMYSLCPHCQSQIEAAQGLEHEGTAAGVRILYIDSPAESPSIIDAYAARLGIGGSDTAPILMDNDGSLAGVYGITYYPATILIDAHGIVAHVWIGETGGSALHSAIDRLARAETAGGQG